MPKNELGEIRRSQILQNGPGAIIDFRAGDQGGGAVSVLTSGLDQWEETAKVRKPISTDTNVVFEPRLQKKLSKNYFRMSPVILEDDQNEERYQPHIQGIRFPKWLTCPSCNRLAEAKEFGSEIGDPSRWCSSCTKKEGRRVHVVPIRFIVACENGHISDFPWFFFFSKNSTKQCSGENRCKLYLKSDGNSSGLDSLFLYCGRCSGKASIGPIFKRGFLKTLGHSCSGERPWIGDKQDCGAEPRTIQRGASNVYFAKVESALSIPPWDNPLEELLYIPWQDLIELEKPERDKLLQLMAPSQQLEPQELIATVDRRIEYLLSTEDSDLRKEEYLNFVEATENPDTDPSSSQEFRVRKQSLSARLSDYFQNLVKVERLKEVRVQTGFSRINSPPPGYDPEDEKNLSFQKLDWLPASVVKGEGIFLNLERSRTEIWKEHKLIQKRTMEIKAAFEASLRDKGLSPAEQEFQVTPEFILIHTLSHLLINQLALRSGYNAASIKERLFVGGERPEMNGVLIFTGTSDSDGTLGGLARLAETNLFENLVLGAVGDSMWCSSDPICSDGIISTSESTNKAACHSCALLPETSCEHFNSFLDRAFVVGTPNCREAGYLTGLLE